LFFPGEGVPFTNTGADRGLNNEANGWWHIVAATQGTTALERTENIRLWLNGVDRTEDMLPGTVGWGTDTDMAKIGGRRDDPLDSTTHSGAQDEVAIWLNRTLTDAEALSLYQAAISSTTVGDFNSDGQLNEADVNLLSAQVRAGTNDLNFDLNSDNMVNLTDHNVWVKDLRFTWFGDADLNGEFNSTDFVSVFQAGKFETNNPASWSEGDWNGDGIFSSSDFVKAFQDGGYEKGPRTALQAVPEPGALVLMLIAGACLWSGNRRRSSTGVV
jgi:hypothetical protein